LGFASLLSPLGRQQFSRAFFGIQARLAHHPLRHHVSPHGGVGLERAELGVALHQRLQVVVVQLIGPVWVIAVLVHQTFDQLRLQRYLAGIFPDGATQAPDGILSLSAGTVEPAFERLGREADLAPVHRMRPCLGGQSDSRAVFNSPRAGGALSSTPTTEKRNLAHKMEVEKMGCLVITSPHESRHEGENDCEVMYIPAAETLEEHPLRVGSF
jgi:hypothetical protein